MKTFLFLMISFPLLMSLQCSSAAKILAFLPMPWRSHQFVFRPIIRELALRGHEVDFYTPLPMKNPPSNLTQFFVKDRQEECLADFDEEAAQQASPFQMQTTLSELCVILLEKALTLDQSCIDLLQSTKKYDAVITEFPVGVESTSYLTHKFKGAVSIVILGFSDYSWLNELAGLPDNPSYMVSYLFPSAPEKMSFWIRVKNVYTTVSIIVAAYWDTWRSHQVFADKYIRYEGWETRPKLTDVMSDVALFLTNSHVSTGYPYPKAPHVKEISGVHVDPQPLPPDLQKFMDDAPHGVIFFSLGSIANPKTILVDGKFEIFVRVFKRLKQKVMWKVAAGMPEVNDPKIKLQTWFPQQGILNHKNVVLFITHGGLQSMIEAIAAGVPCLGMPVMFDQKKDVSFIESIGTGRLLDFSNLTESSLEWSINEMLTNPRYREQALKRQALYHDRPMKPLDEAIYWIEYVLRHGNILQPASVHLPFYQLYMLDILAVILLAFFAIFFISKRIISVMIRALCRRSSVKTKIQ